MINPYSGINWGTHLQIHSISHAHSTTQEEFNYLYEDGIRHFPISNYYLSTPFYPLGDFITPPLDAIGCPNAEHHGMTDTQLHLCAIGSTFTSGTEDTQAAIGVNANWRSTFASVISTLIYTNGGGITLNHPIWSKLPFLDILKFLDYSQLVLGVEIYNDSSVEDKTNAPITLWDKILSTGRRCWGFCVSDHSARNLDAVWNGRNILLTPDTTEQSCAVAYRNGAFYGALKGNGLTFTNITVTSSQIQVSTNQATRIEFFSNKGRVKQVYEPTAVYALNREEIFVRMEAFDASGERLFSQPIMFKNVSDVATIQRRKRYYRDYPMLF